MAKLRDGAINVPHFQELKCPLQESSSRWHLNLNNFFCARVDHLHVNKINNELFPLPANLEFGKAMFQFVIFCIQIESVENN